VLVKSGASVMMLQADLTADKLLHELTALLLDQNRLATMGEKARTLAHPGALEKIAATAIKLTKN
jgi:UDP-N-acetylglucosamine--N-acetylmuramyl-(pentapeptide) pyrophosphoryl-undecaprenol N-acetylglucosamine transferase